MPNFSQVNLQASLAPHCMASRRALSSFDTRSRAVEISISAAKRFDLDFRSWVFLIEVPPDVFLFNLPVIVIYPALHPIEYDTFIQIWAPGSIVYINGRRQ